jgi:DNA repair protein RadC
MPNSKGNKDNKRFSRCQSVVEFLSARESFQKPQIYEALKGEKPSFIGRIINQLVRDDFLNKNGPRYFWSSNKNKFHAEKWIHQQIFTFSVKRSPLNDRPRERLLRLGPSALKNSELFAILVRSGVRGESALESGEKLAALFGNSLELLSQKGGLLQIEWVIFSHFTEPEACKSGL